MADQGQELQKPGAPQSAEPVIHVIPEKFYGAALKQKAPPMKPPVEPPQTPPPAPPVPPVAPPPVPGASGAKPKKKFPVLLVVIIALLLLVGGGAATYFLVIKKKPAPVAKPPVTAPAGPVCGDGKCEAPKETTASCVADCPAPVPEPVCGDAKCEAPKETLDSCAADCAPPAPKCGDAKCDEGETVEACPADCKPAPIVPGVDTDADGLTDEEEKTIYGTDVTSQDTDKDTFLDFHEVEFLFDPTNPDPARLRTNPGIAPYADRTLGIEMLRPAAWTMNAAADGVTFTAQGGETLRVTMVSKPVGQSLVDWYAAAKPEALPAQPYRTREERDAIADGSTVYVDGGDRVFTTVYDLGPRRERQYDATLRVLTQSFKLLPK